MAETPTSELALTGKDHPFYRDTIYPTDVMHPNAVAILGNSQWLDTEIHITVDQTRPDKTVFGATFEAALSGDDFIDFLNDVAPSRVKMRNPGDILADWDLPDRVHREDTLLARHLGREHSHVKVDTEAQAFIDSFQKFVNAARPAFMRAVKVSGPSWRQQIEDTQQTPYSLIPRLEWTRSKSGVVSWVNDPRHEAIADDEAPRSGLDHSSLLGLLVLAHLSPGLRSDPDKWPTKMNLPGGRGQHIGLVQVPVVAIKQSQALLDHPVVTHAHAFAA